MLRTTLAWTLSTALVLAAAAHAAPPKPDFTNLPAYITALNASTDPQAVAIRLEIADGPAALARERAAAQAAGIPLDAAQLQRPLPPADQNAAPLFQQLDALRSKKPLNLPHYAQPLSNRYIYTPAQIATVQQIVDSRRDVFDLLHQAANKPQCVFVRNWSLGAALLFPEIASLRENARELNTESYLLAAQGRYSEAITTQALGFRVAQAAASDPTLINYLVAVAIDEITLSGMDHILYQWGSNADVDTLVQQTISSDDLSLSLKYPLGGEVALMLTTLEPLRRSNAAQFSTAFTPGPAQSQSITTDGQLFVGDLISAEEARFISEMLPIIAVANGPSRARHAIFAAAQTSPVKTLDPVTMLDGILMPLNFLQIENKDEQIHALEQVTMAAAAILAVKARTGTFPSTLPGNFMDSFSNKPLGYRREGDDGFVVYSVGVSGTFDGGTVGQYQFTPYQSFFRYPGPTPQPVPTDMVR
jgi:hypothetical protein